MKTAQIMTKDPVCCARSETAEVAASLMDELNTGVIPIVENEKSYKLVGVVTDRDLCMSVIAAGKNPKKVTLDQCMTENPVVCKLDDDVNQVLQLMQRHQVHRVPVISQEQDIEGIVSIADIILKSDVPPGEITQTLKEISEPMPQIVHRMQLIGQ